MVTLVTLLTLVTMLTLVTLVTMVTLVTIVNGKCSGERKHSSFRKLINIVLRYNTFLLEIEESIR